MIILLNIELTTGIRKYILISFVDLYFYHPLLSWQSPSLIILVVVYVRFNTTFNNISLNLWLLILLVKEIEVPSENHPSASSPYQILSNNAVLNTLNTSQSGNENDNFCGDRRWLFYVAVSPTTIGSLSLLPQSLHTFLYSSFKYMNYKICFYIYNWEKTFHSFSPFESKISENII